MATSSGEQQLHDQRLRMLAGGTHAGNRHEYWPGGMQSGTTATHCHEPRMGLIGAAEVKRPCVADAKNAARKDRRFCQASRGRVELTGDVLAGDDW